MSKALVEAIKAVLRKQGKSGVFSAWCREHNQDRVKWYKDKRKESPEEVAARLLNVPTSEIYKRMEGKR